MTKALSTRKMLTLLVADHGKCMAIATAITCHAQNAKDVVSDSNLSALEQIRAGRVSFENAGRFYAWLHRIVRRTATKAASKSQSKYEQYDENIHTGENADLANNPLEYLRMSMSSLCVPLRGCCWAKSTAKQGAAPDRYE